METRDGRKLTGETIDVYVIEDVVNVKSGFVVKIYETSVYKSRFTANRNALLSMLLPGL